jgi:hypothetical protein
MVACDWTQAAWLSVLFVLLLLLKRWLSQHLQGLALLLSGSDQIAALLYYLILLPGIVLHELSHAVAAELVGVETKGVSLRPSAQRGGRVRLGAVTVRPSDPLRESWIGLAPLLTGTIAILLLARWQFGLESLPELRPDTLLLLFASCLQTPDAWLWLYLVFAISNAMLPSRSDRQPWLPVVLFLALVIGASYALGFTPQIPEGLSQWTLAAVTHLTLSFGLAVMVDVVFAAVVFALEKAGEVVLHRHVEY